MQGLKDKLAHQTSCHQHVRCWHAPVVLLNVLEAFEVEAEDGRQHFDLEPLLCLLQARAGVAEKLVLCIQGLCRAAANPTADVRKYRRWPSSRQNWSSAVAAAAKPPIANPEDISLELEDVSRLSDFANSHPNRGGTIPGDLMRCEHHSELIQH